MMRFFTPQQKSSLLEMISFFSSLVDALFPFPRRSVRHRHAVAQPTEKPPMRAELAALLPGIARGSRSKPLVWRDAAREIGRDAPLDVVDVAWDALIAPGMPDFFQSMAATRLNESIINAAAQSESRTFDKLTKLFQTEAPIEAKIVLARAMLTFAKRHGRKAPAPLRAAMALILANKKMASLHHEAETYYKKAAVADFNKAPLPTLHALADDLELGGETTSLAAVAAPLLMHLSLSQRFSAENQHFSLSSQETLFRLRTKALTHGVRAYGVSASPLVRRIASSLLRGATLMTDTDLGLAGLCAAGNALPDDTPEAQDFATTFGVLLQKRCRIPLGLDLELNRIAKTLQPRSALKKTLVHLALDDAQAGYNPGRTFPLLSSLLAVKQSARQCKELQAAYRQAATALYEMNPVMLLDLLEQDARHKNALFLVPVAVEHLVALAAHHVRTDATIVFEKLGRIVADGQFLAMPAKRHAAEAIIREAYALGPDAPPAATTALQSVMDGLPMTHEMYKGAQKAMDKITPPNPVTRLMRILPLRRLRLACAIPD